MNTGSENFTGARKTLNIVYKVGSKIVLAFLIFVALFLLYIGISSKIYQVKGEKKYEPKFSLYSIASRSMVPTINVYDIIVDKRVDDPTEIKKGDIITFLSTSSYSEGLTITHRVMDVRQNENGEYEYVTQGDNNMSPDAAYAPYKNVLGKVIFWIPKFGIVQEFLANKYGWILVVIIPTLIIIIKDIIKLAKLAKLENKASNTSSKPNVYKNSSDLEQSRRNSIKRKLDE